ncbi:hypothetical protein T484DRAFT_1842607 [Baffinella frigidus]|nr:hypothetical protein T484DRAFT_1842607 [Cryptophyta sp. CCMP2293]
MEYVPTSVSAVSLSKLVLALDAKHWPGNSIVNLTTDPENKLLVSADEGGFIKTWDISSYDWAKPHESQVKPIAFWRAHEAGGITSVDMILPHPDEDAPDAPPIPPLTPPTPPPSPLWYVPRVTQLFPGKAVSPGL